MRGLPLCACLLVLACRDDTPPRSEGRDEPEPARSAAPPSPPPPPPETPAPRDWEIRDAGGVAFDGRRVAVWHDASFDGPYLSVVDAATGETVAKRLPAPGDLRELRWSPDGARLAVVTAVQADKGTPTLELHLLEGGKLSRALRALDLRIAFNPATGEVLVAHWGNIEIRDERATDVEGVLPGAGRITALVVRSDGAEVIAARRVESETLVEIWDLSSRARRHHIRCGDVAIDALAFSRDWSRFAWAESSARADGAQQHQVAVADRAGVVLRSAEAIGGAARRVAFSADARWLLSISNGPVIWRAADLARHIDLRPGEGERWGAAFVPASDRLAIYTDGALRLVDLGTGRTLASTELEIGRGREHAFSPDGQWLAAAAFMKTVVVALPTP